MSTFRKNLIFLALAFGATTLAMAQESTPAPNDQETDARDTLRLSSAAGALHATRVIPGAPQQAVIDHSKPETARDSQAHAPETARDHESPKTLPETAVDSQAHAPETAQDDPRTQPETARDSQKDAPQTAVDDPRRLPETATDALRASDARKLEAARAAQVAAARPKTPPQ